MKNKTLQYVSIAAKAGKVYGGELQTENRLKNGSAKLLILAEDASENTKKKFINLAKRYRVPVAYAPDREALGASCGKDLRSTVVICDEGIARAIVKANEVPMEGNS